MEKRQPFYQNQMYHIFNCGNGNEPIFRCDQNYEFFLNKYRAYMNPWWETHAYCLLPDQFHFIIDVKPNELGTTELTKVISRTFGDLCNGYVQAYNKHHHRKGSLLRRAYKRELIYKTDVIRDLTCYLHNSPLRHKLVTNMYQWRYSSYAELLNSSPEDFQTHPLLRHFGSQDEFVTRHKLQFGAGTIELPYVSAA